MEHGAAFEISMDVRTPTGARKHLRMSVALNLEESDPEGRSYLLSERCVELHQAVADAVHWLCRSGVTGDGVGNEPHEELASIVAAIMGQIGAEGDTNKAWPLICERMRDEREWPKVEMP